MLPEHPAGKYPKAVGTCPYSGPTGSWNVRRILPRRIRFDGRWTRSMTQATTRRRCVSRTMNKHKRVNTLVAGLLALTAPDVVTADDVKILAADFRSLDSHRWSVSVTLKHGDTGWDHYADRWRVVDDEGNVLGDRVLFHPHVEEQPFTRGLGSVQIPEGTTTVRIEAHDKVHGWSRNPLLVDLSKAGDGRLRVETDQEEFPLKRKR